MTQDKAETGSRINGGILRHPQASSGILRHPQALSGTLRHTNRDSYHFFSKRRHRTNVFSLRRHTNRDSYPFKTKTYIFLCEDIPTVIPIFSCLKTKTYIFLCEDIPTVIPILSFLKRRHRTKMMRKEEKERHITVCMNKGKHPKITQGFVEKLGELLSRLLVWFIKTP